MFYAKLIGYANKEGAVVFLHNLRHFRKHACCSEGLDLWCNRVRAARLEGCSSKLERVQGQQCSVRLGQHKSSLHLDRGPVLFSRPCHWSVSASPTCYPETIMKHQCLDSDVEPHYFTVFVSKFKDREPFRSLCHPHIRS